MPYKLSLFVYIAVSAPFIYLGVVLSSIALLPNATILSSLLTTGNIILFLYLSTYFPSTFFTHNLVLSICSVV